MDDRELYQLMQTDAERGMRVCIEEYYALVSRICRGILPHAPQDAEECINESFLRLWQTLDALQEPAHLRAYLCMIARNRALTVYRKNRTAAVQRCDDLPERSDADFIAELDRKADAEALQAAVMQLKEPDREIFVRKYYYLESMASLGRRFGMPVKKTDNILYRSKQRLRKILKEDAE